MAAGVTGHHGLPARSPVVLALSHASVSATPQHLKWKAKIARVKVGKLRDVRNHHVRVSEHPIPYVHFLFIKKCNCPNFCCVFFLSQWWLGTMVTLGYLLCHLWRWSPKP